MGTKESPARVPLVASRGELWSGMRSCRLTSVRGKRRVIRLGKSHYRNAARLASKGVHFVDVGTPGCAHVWGYWRKSLVDLVLRLFQTKGFCLQVIENK